MRFKRIAVVSMMIFFAGCMEVEEGSAANVLSEGDRLLVDGVLMECQPDSKPFEAAKTGEPCDFSGRGCGWAQEILPDDEETQTGREVNCVDEVISVTEVYYVRDEAPREDVLWEDCDALQDGRGYEACQGEFVCYKPGETGCLESIFCADWEGTLRHIEYCDDPEDDFQNEERPVVTDCEGAFKALPLDPCQGDFLCESSFPISACDSGEGYCNPQDQYPSRLIWCDGETLHIYWGGFHV